MLCLATGYLQLVASCEEMSAHSLALHESCFILKDGQSVLQALDLGLTTGLSLCVSFWFCNAPVLNFSVVIHNCSKLSVRRFPICLQIANVFVETSELLSLILHILILESLSNLVLLCRLLVLGFSIVLFGSLLSQIVREVGLDYFKDTNNAVSSARSCCVKLRPCRL